MKAATRTKYGDPDVITVKQIDKPTPKPNELLVKVHACTVNRTDIGILNGYPYLIQAFTGLGKPKDLVPGTDFAGVVEAVGNQVNKFNAGDKVWGLDDNGIQSQAEYMTIREDKPISLIPDGITFEQAAAAPEGAHYAVNFINKIKLQTGQKVLVNGATGAIGSAAVQILKHLEIRVTAVCNTKNIERVKSLGAERVIDYLTEDFTQVLKGESFPFVFDAVGKSSFSKCKPLLEKGGVYISTELGKNWDNVWKALYTPLFSSRKVIFPLPTNIKGSMAFIKKLLESGEFKPVIDKSYPLDEIAKAYSYVASGQKTGNVIITP